MLEQVELKIKELKKLQADEYYKRKDADLDAWGLTSKKNGKKTTPIIVTDDEYEALVKAASAVRKTGRNPVANTLKAFSVASIIVSLVAGVVLWYTGGNVGFVRCSVAVLLGIVVAVLFHGISEAIRLLQQIIDMKPMQKPDPVHSRNQQINVTPINTQPVNHQQVPYQYMTAQPPIYQAAAYRQPMAQPYYAPQQPPVAPQAPVQQAPVAPQAQEENTTFGAPQNYTEMGTFEREVQDDFFAE